MFIDRVTIHVKAGDGGRGCMAFRREKFVPLGGPAGGDGGGGGSVLLRGDGNLNTLYHFRFHPLLRAGKGNPGKGSNRHGGDGDDLIVGVPLGTIVRDAATGEVLGDITEKDQLLVVVKGGDGGRGNARFKTSTNQAPRRAEPGWPGGERDLELELKLLADVAIVGLPNAGKSTLISTISAARPKIADYPFTTLTPNLGVVDAGDHRTFVVADIPGLIEGAHTGAGLGVQFLRHVERCRVLVHLVELTVTEDLASRVGVIETELAAWNPELAARPRLLVGSKLDAAAPGAVEALERCARERDLPHLAISAATRHGLAELIVVLSRAIASAPPPPAPEPGRRSAEA